MTVQTRSGKVEGQREGKLWCYRGIPYARAERFCAPVRYIWEGVLDAVHFGKRAIQAGQTAPGAVREEYGEDCLSLNIFVPDGEREKLPVAVYIHGGGFQDGSSRERDAFQVIRDHRFIYVSVNYRLGVLGYLYLGNSLGEKWQHTGNCGTLDQLAALRWIHENIEAFGGDRNRVTVFGESAGAKTLGALLLKPEMEEYCSQVLMASGAWQCIREEETAAAVARDFFREARRRGLLEREEEILTMDADRILEVQRAITDNPGNTCMFGPVADGTVIPRDWRSRIRDGRYWHGRAMVGSCLHELIFRREEPDFTEKAPAIADALFGRNGEIARCEFAYWEKEYACSDRPEGPSEEEKADKWLQILSDYMYRTYSHRLAENLTENGSRVWYYSFEYGRACHVQDQSMAFDGSADNEWFCPGVSEKDRKKMAEAVYGACVRFFEMGDPNGGQLPHWPSLDEEKRVLVWADPIHTRVLEADEVLHGFPQEVYNRCGETDSDERQGFEPAAAVIDAAAGRETLWVNPDRKPFEQAEGFLDFDRQDMLAAEARLERFAPLLVRLFPELEESGGIIESMLQEIPHMDFLLTGEGKCGQTEGIKGAKGRIFLKMDSHLPVSGSVKARGGIYEVLAHTEKLALGAGLLKEDQDRGILAEHRDFFSGYTIQVGSTGNLGMSIGIMSAAIGYRTVVHMSADAREWKKELLRSRGVIVKEYEGDYTAAVEEGRRLSDADESSYFVDDEHSSELFLGYSTAALRLKRQLEEQNIPVDKEHPLFVTIPCGVGGAPGGITFGLKEVFKDAVHCFFAEPVDCPCMLLGMASGEDDRVCVQDFGLSGRTMADGLAVGRASGLAARNMKPLVSGIVTVKDERLTGWMRQLKERENIVIEPSACAAFMGPLVLGGKMGERYLKENGLAGAAKRITHVVWATGGSFMPKEVVYGYLKEK